MKRFCLFVFLFTVVLSSKAQNDVAITKLLQDKIESLNANYGEIIILETGTGNIITQICLDNVGKPYNDLFEKETTDFLFSPTYLAIMESGKATPNTIVNTGKGVYKGVKDHNWNRGGYGKITLEYAFTHSSEVAFSKIKKRTGNLNQYVYGNTLMDLLTFYDAVANNGITIAPTDKDAVDAVEIDLNVSKESLALLQKALRLNITEGFGQKANSEKVDIAGRGRRIEVKDNVYRLEFFGYFPATNPRYTMVVVLEKDHLPASDGGMCAPIFKEAAELLIE